MQLQVAILAVAPNAELKFKWRIPFFYHNNIPICFLNQTKDYVDLGFWHGNKLNKFNTYFITANLKSVSSLRYRTIEDINQDVLTYVISK